MHPSVQEFVRACLDSEQVKGKRVLEVGAYDVNGSVRPYVQSLVPESYLATDMRAGPGVDQVVEAENLRATFGDRDFDIVICCEMLEHARDWQACMLNMLGVLRLGGLLLLTTRSHGFPQHGFPDDYWRFSLADMSRVVQWLGLELLRLQTDPLMPGVFLFAQRPFTDRLPEDNSFSESMLLPEVERVS